MINNIKKRLSNVDEVLPILMFWELIYLGVGEAIIIFLPLDRARVALGFFIGVLLAMLSSFITAFIMKKLFSAKKRTIGIMLLALIGRLSIAGGVVALALYTNFASPVAILIGMLSMQLGVYFEPMARNKRLAKEALLKNTQKEIKEEVKTEVSSVNIRLGKGLHQEKNIKDILKNAKAKDSEDIQ